MALVNVMISGRAYTIACDDGEEEHLRELGALVDAKAREAQETVGQVGDQRLLLMAALLMADEVFEARNRLATLNQEPAPVPPQPSADSGGRGEAERIAAQVLEQAVGRAEAVIAHLVETGT